MLALKSSTWRGYIPFSEAGQKVGVARSPSICSQTVRDLNRVVMMEKEVDKAHRIAISKHFPVSY